MAGAELKGDETSSLGPSPWTNKCNQWAWTLAVDRERKQESGVVGEGYDHVESHLLQQLRTTGKPPNKPDRIHNTDPN